MTNVKYNRNWAYEDVFDVYFVDGSRCTLQGSTDNKGRIDYLEYNGTRYKPDEFDSLEIAEVHFMTPARLEVKTPVKVLVEVYLRLGQTINQGDTLLKTRRREGIANEIRKRGFNLHDLMSEHCS